MRVPDRFRFPALLALLFAGSFGAVLLLRRPEGRAPATGPSLIPATPQALSESDPAPAAAMPAAATAETDDKRDNAAPPLPEMRPAAPPEYAYPE